MQRLDILHIVPSDLIKMGLFINNDIGYYALGQGISVAPDLHLHLHWAPGFDFKSLDFITDHFGKLNLQQSAPSKPKRSCDALPSISLVDWICYISLGFHHRSSVDPSLFSWYRLSHGHPHWLGTLLGWGNFMQQPPFPRSIHDSLGRVGDMVQ